MCVLDKGQGDMLAKQHFLLLNQQIWDLPVRLVFFYSLSHTLFKELCTVQITVQIKSCRFFLQNLLETYFQKVK